MLSSSWNFDVGALSTSLVLVATFGSQVTQQILLGIAAFCALALLVPAVAVQAIKEEQKLVDALPDYASYIRRTKRFIPFLV